MIDVKFDNIDGPFFGVNVNFYMLASISPPPKKGERKKEREINKTKEIIIFSYEMNFVNL